MLLKSNVELDELMNELNNANSLSAVDKIKLSLANFVAELYPLSKVYVDAILKDIVESSFLISFKNINKKKLLGDTAHYEFVFVINYVPDKLSNETDLHNIIFKIEQHITDINYPIYSVNSEIKEQIVNITGSIKIREETMYKDLIIKKADKELIV